jgi:cytochrome c556
MIKVLPAFLISAALGAATMTAFAQDELEYASQIKARQSLMTVYRFNLGLLGGMARERTPYDAELAQAAADNMLPISNMKNGAMWPAGSDASAEGYEGVSFAKADLWEDYDAVREKSQNLRAALETMAAEAGNGLDALKANIGGVGNGCKGCHELGRIDRD